MNASIEIIDYIPVTDEQVDEELYYSLQEEAILYEMKNKLTELLEESE